MRLVQLNHPRDGRRVAIVDGGRLRLLATHRSVYELAQDALRKHARLTALAAQDTGADALDYSDVYGGRSDWRLLVPFDHPQEPARCLVSGTGLTHLASVANRNAMHQQDPAKVTDSMRIYQWGVEGGRPGAGQIGALPEWFYKGTGGILRANGEALTVPPFAGDGGEEPEVAGAYLIAPDGTPCRVGFAVGNEFSDHKIEKRNYMYLAHSKLRNCALGPELVVDEPVFDDLSGIVTIERAGAILWSEAIRSGEKNMSHSLENLEHHHFQYAAHRQPGDVHIHFFGAGAFSFGAGIELQDGDVMEVSFPALGRPLRNRLAVDTAPNTLVRVQPL